MVTREQYAEAIKQNDASQKVINEYHTGQREEFEKRLEENPIFSIDELRFAARSRCQCGLGMAYPTDCGPNHHWSCSGILMETGDKDVLHTNDLPFMFHSIVSDNSPRAQGHSTRPVEGVEKE